MNNQTLKFYASKGNIEGSFKRLLLCAKLNM